MQNVGSTLFTVLESSERDLAKGGLFEFYPPEETDLCPGNAEKRFAASSIVWFGWGYERQAISHGPISRFIDGTFNNVSISLSNVDRSVSAWIGGLQDRLEGWRVLIRSISRRVDDDSIVKGVFRCEPVGSVKNNLVQITAKQDLGSIENDLPWDKESVKCPLEFKGIRCLAGQSLGSKSATYQAATACNKSKQQCQNYDNLPAFQGEWFNGITTNFKVSQKRGGAGGAALGLLGLGNKRVTKQHSSQDSSPVGTPTPIILGAAQVEFVPLQTDDTGEYLAGQWMIGAGELTKIQNVRSITSGWADTFQAYAEHRGKFGFDSEQFPLGYFASADQRHSQKAYVEITIKGDNPDTGDPAPAIVGRVLGIKVPAWTGTTFGADAWSDNPVDHTRFLLTEERSLKYDPAWMDNEACGETADYCNEPLKDDTGGEDVYISVNAGVPGTDYKRYRSTGLLDTYFFRKVLGLTSAYSAEREATVTTYNPASPPSSPAITTHYRKRYTTNVPIRETVKAVDFKFKTLLPAYRGYFITSARGKLQIRSEKPTVTSLIRNGLSIGATAVPVEDALAWRSLNLPVIFALIGVGLSTSETRKVASIDFSTAGNSITLSASGSATASGATLSGGTSSVQAQGTITIGSAAAATVTIEGVPLTYTPNADDTTGTIAAMLHVMINADATLNRFVKASWTPSLPTQVIIRSKLGILNVSGGLTYAHDAAEIAAHVHMVFSDVAMGALSRGNISKDGFEWPLGGKAANYNKFVISYQSAVDDYQLTEVDEEDFAHQRKINKVNKKEINGACVDNYHQARRLVVADRYKYREGNYFVQIATTDARAMLLEEGDVICATHSNQPNQRNLMLRVEELKTTDDHKVSIVGRLYADEQFPNSADERTIPLTTGVGWTSTPPGAVTNLILTISTPGTISGTFDFAAYIGSQTAKIYIKKPGDTDYADTGLRVTPDSNNDGAFTIGGIPDGVTYIKVIPYSTAGDGPETIASVDTAAISIDVLEYQVTTRPEIELEVEVLT